MKTNGAIALVALLAAPLFAACTTDTANEGDCSARIRYQGIMYRSHQALNQAAPAGRSLGQGDVVDCGDIESAAKVDEVAVRSIRGVAPSVAVMVKEHDWRGVYVSEEVPSSDWPQVLQGDGAKPQHRNGIAEGRAPDWRRNAVILGRCELRHGLAPPAADWLAVG